ncbi:hypothetical protein [Marinoscillum pacificum]|uniref:hypothetical protein n=1 Tax=Marinoscillum pacificum TaxID=392723 RepID=UPI0021577178|nr:hypothetical protein [Marinoscillum pacificum]
MAKTHSSDQFVKVIDDNWPDDVSASINILHTSNNQLYYFAEYPLSESGDWFIGYRYYINPSNGSLIAFERLANFFNSECTKGVAYEHSIYYFSIVGELVAKSYTLVDDEDADISLKRCYFNYDYAYSIDLKITQLLEY